MIGPGEADDYHLPKAKKIGDPSRRWGKVGHSILYLFWDGRDVESVDLG